MVSWNYFVNDQNESFLQVDRLEIPEGLYLPVEFFLPFICVLSGGEAPLV